MSAYKSDFLRILAERGFIHQVSDAEGLEAKATAHPTQKLMKKSEAMNKIAKKSEAKGAAMFKRDAVNQWLKLSPPPPPSSLE